MWRSRKAIPVDTPPSEVFAYLADVTRHHEWNGVPEAMLSGEQTGLGSRFAHRARREVGAPRGWNYWVDEVVSVETTAYAPPRHIAFRLRADGDTAIRFWIEPRGDDGILVVMETVERLSWWAYALLLPLAPLAWPAFAMWLHHHVVPQRLDLIRKRTGSYST
jgi:uncharacterized protein YndB with AHSA1/START domain